MALEHTPYRSRAGVYTRSPLGVLGYGPDLIMVFMNKTVYAYQTYDIVYRDNAAFWNTDIDIWNDEYDDYIPDKFLVQLCDVEADLVGGIGVNPYDSQGTPDGITAYADFPRAPANVDEFIVAFEQGYDICLPLRPRKIILMTDNAGATMLLALEPGISDFEAWAADEGISIDYVLMSGDYEYEKKRYLIQILNTMEDYS